MGTDNLIRIELLGLAPKTTSDSLLGTVWITRFFNGLDMDP